MFLKCTIFPEKLGFVGVFLERTKYRIRVGRGQAPALPCKMHFVRRGRRLGAPYPLPLGGRWLLPQAKDGGREMKKSLPQSNAAHLTALPSRGTRFCLRLGAPNKIDRFAHKCSLFPPLAAVTFVARQRGHKRRGQAPALPWKFNFVRRGRRRLDDPL